jgi:hypothetical protein
MVKIIEFYQGLSAPFPPTEVKWRVGATTKDKKKGMALAYVDARAVYDRLDDVCGNWGWQCNYSHAMEKTICNLGLFMPTGAPNDNIDDVGFEWIWRANGAGDTQVEAEKGAISDAIKRAAVTFGVGRYLYSLASPWVALNNGRIEENDIRRLNEALKKITLKFEERSKKQLEAIGAMNSAK